MINPRRIGDPELRNAGILLEMLYNVVFGEIVRYSDKDRLPFIRGRLHKIRETTWQIEALLEAFEPRGGQITKLKQGGPSLEVRAYHRWRLRHPHDRPDDPYPLPRDQGA